MAMIVAGTTIITEKCHRVIFGDMLWEFLCEIFDCIPQSWDSLNVLIQAQNEAVFFPIVGHELESVIINVTEKLNAWLDTPIPLVIQH